jgi:hypothetical protein
LLSLKTLRISQLTNKKRVIFKPVIAFILAGCGELLIKPGDLATCAVSDDHHQKVTTTYGPPAADVIDDIFF